MILLTDEEIPYRADGFKDEFYGDIGARDKSIYLDGAKAQLKKVVEWLSEHQTAEVVKGRLCWCLKDVDLQALLKEIE